MREPQGVLDGVLEAGVAAHARAADGAPQRRVVDGDDRAQTDRRLLDDQHALVPELAGEVDDGGHGSWTSSTPGASTLRP